MSDLKFKAGDRFRAPLEGVIRYASSDGKEADVTFFSKYGSEFLVGGFPLDKAELITPAVVPLKVGDTIEDDRYAALPPS